MWQIKDSDWRWAIEGFARYCPVKKKFEQITQNGDLKNYLDLKRDFSFGAKAKLGKVFSEKWFLYGLTSISLSRFNYKLKVVDLDNGGAIDADTSVKKNSIGLSYGLGLSYAINDNWNSAIEAESVHYLTKNFSKDTVNNKFRGKIKARDLRCTLKLERVF